MASFSPGATGKMKVGLGLGRAEIGKDKYRNPLFEIVSKELTTF